MNSEVLAEAIGDVREDFLLEALDYKPAYKETSGHCGFGIFRRIMVAAAVVCCFLIFSAFAVRLFSPLNGDALKLTGTYQGEGVVCVLVENRSQRSLHFQPKVKLIKWLGEEEVPQLGGKPVFTDAEIPPQSSRMMTVDLSGVYDTQLLEQSHPWQWYYLIFTNGDFLFGHKWKCSINFGAQEPNQTVVPDRNYALDAAVLENIEEELRPYFEDDYVGIFAANPMNYSYMQQAQEYLMRCGKRIVPLIDGNIISAPVPEGIIFDDAVPPEKQYTLVGYSSSVHDSFGKLVGATPTEKTDTLQVFLPAYEGAEDQAWVLNLLYFASFDRSQIISGDDCAFIHGQLLTFEELEPYKIYEDETTVSFHVTHLFYTDLRTYVENVYSKERASDNSNVFFDESVYERIEKIAAYFSENLRIISMKEYTETIRPNCQISENMITEQGIYGVIESSKAIEKIIYTVSAESGELLFRTEAVPEDPFLYSLDSETEITSYLLSLSDGVYQLDVSVELSSDVMRSISLWTQVFTIGNVQFPGV